MAAQIKIFIGYSKELHKAAAECQTRANAWLLEQGSHIVVKHFQTGVERQLSIGMAWTLTILYEMVGPGS
jgi:hypothetical protein